MLRKRSFSLLICAIMAFVMFPLNYAMATNYTLSFTKNGWANPIDNMTTSDYGDFDSDSYKKSQNMRHAGVDMDMQTESHTVYAIDDGEVYFTNPLPDKWNSKLKRYENTSVIYIRHYDSNGTAFTAVYGHTYVFDAYKLKPGEVKSVKKGEPIGTTRLFGSYHLHFGINTKSSVPTAVINGNGWGRTMPSDDPTSLGWRDPAVFLSEHNNGQSMSGDHIIISFNPNQSRAEDLYLCDYETNTYITSKATGGYKITCYVLRSDSVSYDGYIYSYIDFARDGTTQKYRPIISTIEKHEFFISNSATVYLNGDLGSPMRFDVYLANGYHFNEPFHWWPYSFYATIQNDEITKLYEIYAVDEFYDEY